MTLAARIRLLDLRRLLWETEQALARGPSRSRARRLHRRWLSTEERMSRIEKAQAEREGT